LALSLAVVAGGCSLSYQLDSLSSRNRTAQAEPTGALRAHAAQASAMPHEGDLAAARAAVNEALGKGGKDLSVPWENPATGARGTVTPLSQTYTSAGTTCRDFLASFVRDGSESWLQGEACRSGQGGWEVRQMKPWRRT
jgi:surface antigen